MAKDSLDEWIYYLKNNALPVRFKAKGLDKVEAQLKIDAMTVQEKTEYTAYMESLAISKSMLETAIMEGEIKGELKGIEKGIERGIEKGIEKGIQVGLEKGIKEGRLKEKFELANKYMVNGMDKTTALDMVGLTEKEFAELSNKYS